MIAFHFINRLKVSFFLNRNNLPIFGKLKFDPSERIFLGYFLICLGMHLVVKA
jgi:hypothetical protein